MYAFQLKIPVILNRFSNKTFIWLMKILLSGGLDAKSSHLPFEMREFLIFVSNQKNVQDIKSFSYWPLKTFNAYRCGIFCFKVQKKKFF